MYWGGWQQLGLRLADGQKYPLLSPVFTPESIQVALRNRAALVAANPNIVILSEVHYHPEFQDKVAAFCVALVKSGVYDGCMLDGWHDDDDTPARIGLIRRMRSAVGEKAILLGNVNERLPIRTAGYLNGMYMEGLYARFFPDWHLAAANLVWGEQNLRKPTITALEGWSARGRDQYPLMRQVTTLSLVFSNGYILFSEPNSPSGDHLHDWYPFWDKSLGRPTGPLATLDRPDLSGAYTRKFDKGEVVFNPPSNHPVTVRFDQPHRSAATNATGQSFTVASGDGDLFLTMSPLK